MPHNPALGGNKVCAIITDQVTEVVCEQEAVEEILVRNAFALFAVPICDEHSKKHRRFYQSNPRRKKVDSSADPRQDGHRQRR